MERIDIEELGWRPYGQTARKFFPNEAIREIAEKVNEIVDWISQQDITSAN